MQAILIHPLDLAEMIKAFAPLEGFKLELASEPPVDDLIEIGGKLFYQTVRVPAQTKNIK